MTVLTEAFYWTMAARVGGDESAPTGLYLAVGGGDSAWDRNPPLLLRSVTRLANEIARKPVGSEHLSFLDSTGADAKTATPHLRVRLRFDSGDANGTLREVGLFGQASGARNSGTLLSYFVHAPIEKSPEMNLERTLHLDLTPRAVTGVQPTRYLGNSHSREVHDVENRKADCQLDKIRFDRRIFFGTAEQAVELGYDKCAFCFGRAQSKR